MPRYLIYVIAVGSFAVAALSAIILWPAADPQDAVERIQSYQAKMPPPVSETVTVTPSVVELVAAIKSGTAVTAPILVYHKVVEDKPKSVYDVTVTAFETQMRFLHDNGYAVISLTDFVAATSGAKVLPPKAVVITLDDGWENQYANAAPILEKYGYNATFFVFTNPIGRDKRFMTWDQLRDLLDRGMTIGCHSKTHPFLHKVKDEKTMAAEVSGSKTALERELGVIVDLFAYPFGVTSPEEEAAVKAAGYRAARAFPGGVNNSDETVFHLQSVSATEDMRRFAAIFRQPEPVVAPPDDSPNGN
ncbi:MAG: polysaccharide deacetylase family protein [Patescibacteria group bacterium]|nr:polysaccharide deacetylase family protein [Patescibacteria group bacterium]